jgi:hypothetical protein
VIVLLQVSNKSGQKKKSHRLYPVALSCLGNTVFLTHDRFASASHEVWSGHHPQGAAWLSSILSGTAWHRT